jgi:hypothetical protein
VFRRNSAGAQDSTAQDRPGAQSLGAPETTKTAEREASRRRAEEAKGRPTPKRSEAERGRRQGITGSPSRARSAQGGRGGRTDSRADRGARYEAMKRGEQWALPAKDRGPARALARDYVDSRRRISEYYMYVMLVMIVVLFIRTGPIQQFAQPIALLLIVFVVVDALFLGRALRKLVHQRLPGESTRGLTMYAVFRALQIRRMRMPAPRVKPGDEF